GPRPRAPRELRARRRHGRDRPRSLVGLGARRGGRRAPRGGAGPPPPLRPGDRCQVGPVSRSRLRESLLALLMLAPSLVLFGVFVFYPLGRTFSLGLHQNDFFGGNQVYVGFKQYGDVLTSSDFRHSLWVTVQYALLTVPIGLALGIGMAVLANKVIRGIGI